MVADCQMKTYMFDRPLLIVGVGSACAAIAALKILNQKSSLKAQRREDEALPGICSTGQAKQSNPQAKTAQDSVKKDYTTEARCDNMHSQFFFRN